MFALAPGDRSVKGKRRAMGYGWDRAGLLMESEGCKLFPCIICKAKIHTKTSRLQIRKSYLLPRMILSKHTLL